MPNHPPNGAGKSTALNALMAVLPSRGRVVFDGVGLAGVPLEERVMLGLALVPEKRERFGSMPVEDNLILGGFRAMRQRVPNWRDELDRGSRCSRGSRSAASSLPARCRAASARCLPWAGR